MSRTKEAKPAKRTKGRKTAEAIDHGDLARVELGNVVSFFYWSFELDDFEERIIRVGAIKANCILGTDLLFGGGREFMKKGIRGLEIDNPEDKSWSVVTVTAEVAKQGGPFGDTLPEQFEFDELYYTNRTKMIARADTWGWNVHNRSPEAVMYACVMATERATLEEKLTKASKLFKVQLVETDMAWRPDKVGLPLLLDNIEDDLFGEHPREETEKVVEGINKLLMEAGWRERWVTMA